MINEKIKQNNKRKKENNVNVSNKKRHVSVNTMPKSMKCKCGGGQSCIIDRRWMGDWVHEDDVFRLNNLPIRKSCIEPYTEEQNKALYNMMNIE